MVIDKENANSILNMVTLARENARSVQEHIPKDLWQCLNEYYHTAKEPRIAAGLKKDDPIGVLDVLIKAGNAVLRHSRNYNGARPGHAAFMNIGKYLERAIQSIDILDVKFGPINTNPDLLTGYHLLETPAAIYWRLRALSENVQERV